MSFVTIYHYTFGHRLAAIAASGALIPTGTTIPPHERKALWYSLRADFEPTALKPVATVGSPIPCRVPFAQLHEIAGAFRFSADASIIKALPWPQVADEINVCPADRVMMETTGRALGATPTDWLATTRPQPLAFHRFDRWDGQSWVAAILADEVQRLAARTTRTVSGFGPRWAEIGTAQV